jgi:hypothetical protein
VIARCRACFRVEDRSVDPPIEVAPGGSRRVEAPERAAVATLVESASGRVGPVVGPCPRCGQPMVGDAGAVAVPSAVGDVALGADGVLRVAGEAASGEEAIRWAAVRYPGEVESGGRVLRAVQVVMVLTMVAPILVWVFSVAFVSLFLYRFPESP